MLVTNPIRRKGQDGFTLVEVLVGLAISTFAVLGAFEALKITRVSEARATSQIHSGAELDELVRTIELTFREAYIPPPGPPIPGPPIFLAPSLTNSLPKTPLLSPLPVSVFNGSAIGDPLLGPCQDLVVRRHKQVSVAGTLYTGVEQVYFTTVCAPAALLPGGTRQDLFHGDIDPVCTGKENRFIIRSYLFFKGPDNPAGNPAPAGFDTKPMYSAVTYPINTLSNRTIAVCFRRTITATGTSVFVQARAQAFNGQPWDGIHFTQTERQTTLWLSGKRDRIEILPP